MLVILGQGVDISVLPNKEILDYKIVESKPKAELLAKSRDCVALYAHDSYFSEVFSPEVSVKVSFYRDVDNLIEKITNTGQVEVNVATPTTQQEPPIIQSAPVQSKEVHTQPIRPISFETEVVEVEPPRIHPKPITVQTPTFGMLVEEEEQHKVEVIDKPKVRVEQPIEVKEEKIEVHQVATAVGVDQVPQFSVDDLFGSFEEVKTLIDDKKGRMDEQKLNIPTGVYIENTVLDDLVTKAMARERQFLLLKGQADSLVSQLAHSKAEVDSLTKQLDVKVREVADLYKSKITELQELSTHRINEANTAIINLSNEKIKLVEEVNKNPLKIYGETPTAVTLRHRNYKANANVSFICKGAGVSASSYYSTIQSLINSKPAVYIDLTCNGILGVLNAIKNPYTSQKLGLTKTMGGNQVGGSVVYPSENVQELSLYNYPLQEVISLVTKGYGDVDIVFIFESIESSSVKTVVNDLSKSNISGTIIVEERINIVMTYQLLGFFDTTNLSLFVLNATSDVQNLLDKVASEINVKVFSNSIDWTKQRLQG